MFLFQQQNYRKVPFASKFLFQQQEYGEETCTESGRGSAEGEG